METICPGRFTAKLDEPVVLFLIGTRINRLSSLPRFAWFVKTMPDMLKELSANRESGLLWYRTYISWPYITVQQYWKSFDHLLAYSSDKSQSHMPAWGRYMRELMKDGTLGIWHETYLIESGKFECVYGNMPVFGLAAAGMHVPAEGRLAGAKDRLSAT
jgi:hypothetical protein